MLNDRKMIPNEEFIKKGIDVLQLFPTTARSFENYRIHGVTPDELTKKYGYLTVEFYRNYLYLCEGEKVKNFFKQIFRKAEIGDTGLYIEDVIFNDPATIIKWEDGTKTVVKCGEHDTYDREKGLAMAIIKKLCGNTGNFNEIFKACGCYEDVVPETVPEEPTETPKEEAKDEKPVEKKAQKEEKAEKE